MHLLEKVKKNCRRARIQPSAATVHALRHFFGAHLRMAGVPLVNIADLMGHQDLSTTQIYAKVQIGYLRDVVSRLTHLVPSMPAESGSPAVGLIPAPEAGVDDATIEDSGLLPGGPRYALELNAQQLSTILRRFGVEPPSEPSHLVSALLRLLG